MSRVYYNEIDRDAVAVLRQLIADGTIAPGDVDERSIRDVQPGDLAGFTQCHFFAGGGLWSVAARLAGWPDDRPLWTGSCPCQPFSAAGRRGGTDDPRHLWPDFHRLIRACRPPVVMGEQVAGAPGYAWFDGVRSDLADEGFASRVVDIPACAVDAPHQRNRLYWIAVADARGRSLRCGGPGEDHPAAGDTEGEAQQRERLWADARPSSSNRGVTLGDAIGSGLEGQSGHGDGRAGGPEPHRSVAAADGGLSEMGNDCGESAGRHAGALLGTQGGGAGEGSSSRHLTHGRRTPDGRDGLHADAHGRGRDWWQEGAEREAECGAIAERHLPRRNGSFWSDAEWIICHDGKARRAQSDIRLLVDGLPGRVGLWRVAGNAIVPVLAAEVISAFLDAESSMTERPNQDEAGR